jgi:hypothetical protein
VAVSSGRPTIRDLSQAARLEISSVVICITPRQTVRASEVLFSIAMLFLPLVFVALVLSRLGGPVLVLGSAVIALTCLPASEFNVPAAASVNALVAAPMFLVGAGFTWSGLRPEGWRQENGGLA